MMFLFLLAFKPEGLTLSEDGSIYFTDMGEINIYDGGIYKMSPRSGRYERLKLTGFIKDPKGIVYNRGYLFVVDENAVWKVKNMSLSKHIHTKEFPGRVEFLRDIAAFGNRMYVSDIYGNTVYKFNFSGNVKVAFHLKRPNGLAVDSTGNVYVITFTSPAHIYKFDGRDTTLLLTSNLLRGGYDLEITPDGKTLYATGYFSNNIVEINLETLDEREIDRTKEHPAELLLYGRRLYYTMPDAGEIKYIKVGR